MFGRYLFKMLFYIFLGKYNDGQALCDLWQRGWRRWRFSAWVSAFT